MVTTELVSGPVSTSLSTVAELIDLAEDLHRRAENVPGRRWAFRGQPRDFGTLEPSFQRQFWRRSVGTAEVIEERLIEAFRAHYRDLRDRGPEMPNPARIESGYDLRCLSVMQHYEIPTRLLDWTSHFWTAVYFACASDPGAQAEIWYYDRRLFDAQRTADLTLASLVDDSEQPSAEPQFLKSRNGLFVEVDPQITPRMREQGAHHTVSASVFADHVPLLRALENGMPSPDGPGFHRVVLAASCKVAALRFLAENFGITAGTIFPDVVGLSRFLRWQFETLRAMLIGESAPKTGQPPPQEVHAWAEKHGIPNPYDMGLKNWEQCLYDLGYLGGKDHRPRRD